MAYKDEMGKRMKENYENRAKTSLTRRLPVALRLDGKSFHHFLRDFKKPFDEILVKSMQATMKYLCENIQGCVFGYTQSDEITLILVDYQRLNSSAWFDYDVQKVCSVSASMATMAFNKIFANNVFEYLKATICKEDGKTTNDEDAYLEVLQRAIEEGAMFDSRCFNIPKEEVNNLVLWRQLDASKNSVQMVARSYFADRELKGKNTNEMQDMIFQKANLNWNDLPTPCKRGTACRKTEEGWELDYDMPRLNENTDYVNSLIYVGEQ